MIERLEVPIDLKYQYDNIEYKPRKFSRKNFVKKSIKPTGLDTEANRAGKCFMICTSLGDIFEPSDLPQCFFTRKYRGAHFVCYNLKYDEGHLVQFLPRENLEELWKKGKTTWNGYTVNCIPKKMLKISYKKNCVTIWDIAGFFKTSLKKISGDLLKETKIDLDPNLFTDQYISENREQIAEYCIKDSLLTQKLADYLITHFEKFGVYPRKLYSTAYISGMYFQRKCDCPQFNRFWNHYEGLSQFALASYRGGKFEVTEKGIDNYNEYDLNSAYPYEIANLIDITHAQVIHSKKYRKNAVYAFLKCRINLTEDFHHTLSIKEFGLCVYPIGTFITYLTKAEYDYFIQENQDIEILDAYWLETSWLEYPYKEEIERLYAYKNKCKQEGNKIDYQIVKIFLNSFYGKMIQLIKEGDKWKAGKFFHPIYASIITANTRLRVANMQQKHISIVGCFTDSIISTKKLNLSVNGDLGQWGEPLTGHGMIIGSGIYQIGQKVKFRGFTDRWPLWWMLDHDCRTIKTTINRPHTWREIIFHNWDMDLINKWVNVPKKIDVDFDRKRIWIDDWEKFSDIIDRKVYSTPRFYEPVLGLL